MNDFRENDVSVRRRRTTSAPDGAGAGLPAPGPGGDTDVLSAPPFDDAPGVQPAEPAEPAEAPRARRRLGLTAYLGAGVLLAAGFAIGAQTDRHVGGTGSSATVRGGSGMPGALPGSGRGGRPSGAPGSGGTRSAASAGSTTGTVKKIKGRTVYLQTSSGVVQVKVTGTTKIRLLRNGSASDLAAGASVTVQGTTAADGTVTAKSVDQNGTSGG